ncbi:hypothetical protein TIFTF001_053078, partial [Ficus carica]
MYGVDPAWEVGASQSSSQNPTSIIPIESEPFVIQPVSQPVVQTTIPQ